MPSSPVLVHARRQNLSSSAFAMPRVVNAFPALPTSISTTTPRLTDTVSAVESATSQSVGITSAATEPVSISPTQSPSPSTKDVSSVSVPLSSSASPTPPSTVIESTSPSSSLSEAASTSSAVSQPTSSAVITASQTSDQTSSSVGQTSSSLAITSPAYSSQNQASTSPTGSAVHDPVSDQATSSLAAAVVTTASSAVSVTTTDASGHTVTTAPAIVTEALTSTNAAGKVYTVTQIVHNSAADGSASAASASNATFFDNTGAVAGTFVAVGLAVTAAVLALMVFVLRRRRRQRLDRDVAAAATAAAAAAHSRDWDDEEDQQGMAQHSGYYAATQGNDIHGQPQPPLHGEDYYDPSGGYDSYAANMTTMAVGNRSSTATAAGLAGFGAQSAQATYGQQEYQDQGTYEELSQPHDDNDDPSNAGMAQPSNRVSNGKGYFFDPSQANDYADEDAYGGFDDEPPSRYSRADSEGSIALGPEARGLKVTNG